MSFRWAILLFSMVILVGLPCFFLFQITIHLLDTIFPQSYDSNEQFVIQRAENFSGRFFCWSFPFALIVFCTCDGGRGNAV